MIVNNSIVHFFIAQTFQLYIFTISFSIAKARFYFRFKDIKHHKLLEQANKSMESIPFFLTNES